MGFSNTQNRSPSRLSSVPSISVVEQSENFGARLKVQRYDPSDFQMMKIEASLGKLCSDLALDESIRSSYREKIDEVG